MGRVRVIYGRGEWRGQLAAGRGVRCWHGGACNVTRARGRGIEVPHRGVLPTSAFNVRYNPYTQSIEVDRNLQISAWVDPKDRDRPDGGAD